jgi:hypothetical protein
MPDPKEPRSNKPASGPNPGDDASPGTPGTGENVCRACAGTGRQGDGVCRDCGGTGRVVEGIGGG